MLLEGKLYAKGDQEDTRAQTNATKQTADARSTDQYNTLNNQVAAAGTAGQAERSNILGNYNSFAATGGISDADRQALMATGSVTGPSGSSGSVSGSGGGGGGGNQGTGGTPSTPQSYAGTGGMATNYGGPSGSAFSYLNAPTYDEPYTGYQDFAKTGGVDLSKPISTYDSLQSNPIDQSGIDSSISNLNNFAATGGVTADEMSQLNRPLFDEFEQTGGYSAGDIANIKKEGNATIPSFYSGLQDTLDRQRASSGYGPGFSDANQALTRQAAQETGNQDVSTNINISNAVRQGRMAAAQQKAANALGLIQYTTPAKEAALASAGSLGLNTQDLITKTKLAAAQGDVQAQQLIQSGKLAGLGGEANIQTQQFNNQATKAQGEQQYTTTEDQIAAMRAASSGQLGLGYANLDAQNQRYLIGATQSGQLAGNQGLLNTYNSQYAPLTQSEGALQAGMNGGNGADTSYLNILNNNAQQPGAIAQGFGNVFKGAGAVAGALSGLGGLTNPFSNNTAGAQGYDPESGMYDPYSGQGWE